MYKIGHEASIFFYKWILQLYDWNILASFVLSQEGHTARKTCNIIALWSALRQVENKFSEICCDFRLDYDLYQITWVWTVLKQTNKQMSKSIS